MTGYQSHQQGAHEPPRPLATLRARWKWACAGVVLSIAAGLFAGGYYSDRQEFAGTILHTPLSSGEAGKHLIPTADIKSLGTLLKSPENLRTVVVDKKLNVSPQALAERLDVKTVPGSPTLAVTLQWRGPGDGAAVLDAAMEQFVARASEVRRQRMEERAADFAAARDECERELQQSRERLTAFYEKHKLTDLPIELRKATAESEVTAAALTSARRAEAVGRAQLEELDSTVERLAAKGQVAEPNATPVQLQQMITDERIRAQSQAKLEIKRRELEAVRTAAAKGAVSRVELSRIESEVAGLEVLAQDNEKVELLKKELTGPARAGAPSLLQQAFAKKLDLDLQRLGFSAELPVLEADGEVKRLRLERLLKLQAQAAPLLWQVERVEAERNRLQAHIDQLRVLLAMSGGEARVYLPAASVPRPFSGARAWMLPAAFGGCTLLLCLGAVVAFRPHVEAHAVAGLDLLASIPTRDAAKDNDPEVRSLALGLRQRLPRAGSAIMFTPVHGGPRTCELLTRTAECLAERDERVLIVDADFANRNPRSTETGLSNYLAFECVRPVEVVRQTMAYGVDYLPAGNAAASPDALATHRMRDLVEQLRRTYSIILVAGPPASTATDIQILAAYQDGAVLLLDAPDAAPALTRELFGTYRRVGVPFLGCVHMAS